MNQPTGFLVKGKDHTVCELKKSMYELKQTSNKWNLKFNDIIVSFEFKKNIVD